MSFAQKNLFFFFLLAHQFLPFCTYAANPLLEEHLFYGENAFLWQMCDLSVHKPVTKYQPFDGPTETLVCFTTPPRTNHPPSFSSVRTIYCTDVSASLETFRSCLPHIGGRGVKEDRHPLDGPILTIAPAPNIRPILRAKSIEPSSDKEASKIDEIRGDFWQSANAPSFHIDDKFSCFVKNNLQSFWAANGIPQPAPLETQHPPNQPEDKRVVRRATQKTVFLLEWPKVVKKMGNQESVERTNILPQLVFFQPSHLISEKDVARLQETYEGIEDQTDELAFGRLYSDEVEAITAVDPTNDPNKSFFEQKDGGHIYRFRNTSDPAAEDEDEDDADVSAIQSSKDLWYRADTILEKLHYGAFLYYVKDAILFLEKRIADANKRLPKRRARLQTIKLSDGEDGEEVFKKSRRFTSAIIYQTLKSLEFLNELKQKMQNEDGEDFKKLQQAEDLLYLMEGAYRCAPFHSYMDFLSMIQEDRENRKKISTQGVMVSDQPLVKEVSNIVSQIVESARQWCKVFRSLSKSLPNVIFIPRHSQATDFASLVGFKPPHIDLSCPRILEGMKKSLGETQSALQQFMNCFRLSVKDFAVQIVGRDKLLLRAAIIEDFSPAFKSNFNNLLVLVENSQAHRTTKTTKKSLDADQLASVLSACQTENFFRPFDEEIQAVWLNEALKCPYPFTLAMPLQCAPEQQLVLLSDIFFVHIFPQVLKSYTQTRLEKFLKRKLVEHLVKDIGPHRHIACDSNSTMALFLNEIKKKPLFYLSDKAIDEDPFVHPLDKEFLKASLDPNPTATMPVVNSILLTKTTDVFDDISPLIDRLLLETAKSLRASKEEDPTKKNTKSLRASKEEALDICCNLLESIVGDKKTFNFYQLMVSFIREVKGLMMSDVLWNLHHGLLKKTYQHWAETKLQSFLSEHNAPTLASDPEAFLPLHVQNIMFKRVITPILIEFQEKLQDRRSYVWTKKFLHVTMIQSSATTDATETQFNYHVPLPSIEGRTVSVKLSDKSSSHGDELPTHTPDLMSFKTTLSATSTAQIILQAMENQPCDASGVSNPEELTDSESERSDVSDNEQDDLFGES